MDKEGGFIVMVIHMVLQARSCKEQAEASESQELEKELLPAEKQYQERRAYAV